MAEALVKKAEKEKGRWFVSEETKATNAADYLEQAANMYKSQKAHKEAAGCFVKAAALKQKIGRGYDAAGLFKHAGIQLKLADDPTSVQMLNRAVDIYSQLGKGSMAAKLSKELGEAAEKASRDSDDKKADLEDALIHFERASDLFKGEGSDTHSRQMMEKVAIFHAQLDAYSKAGEIFEELGTEALSSRLGRFIARKMFFRGVLCVMAAGDVIGARAKHNQFKEQDFQFGTSREGKFTNLLIEALEAFDGEKFSQAYIDYIEISPLDPWHTKVLRESQKILTGDDDVTPVPKKAPAAGQGNGFRKAMPMADFLGNEGGGGGGAAKKNEEQVPNLPTAGDGAGEDSDGDSDDDGMFS